MQKAVFQRVHMTCALGPTTEEETEGGLNPATVYKIGLMSLSLAHSPHLKPQATFSSLVSNSSQSLVRMAPQVYGSDEFSWSSSLSRHGNLFDGF
jgi:hypothetical protein